MEPCEPINALWTCRNIVDNLRRVTEWVQALHLFIMLVSRMNTT